MKTLRVLNWVLSAYYAGAFVLYLAGAYTPSPTTIGVALLLSSVAFVQNAIGLK